MARHKKDKGEAIDHLLIDKQTSSNPETMSSGVFFFKDTNFSLDWRKEIHEHC